MIYRSPKPFRRFIRQSLVPFGIDGRRNHDVPQKAKVIWIGLAGENPRACQSACQACPFGTRLVFGCASVDVISLLLTVINRLPTSTYRTQARSHNPEVVGSNPAPANYL